MQSLVREFSLTKTVDCKFGSCYDKFLTTDKGLSGDLLIASGMVLELVVILVGASYTDRGMRNEQHDTVAAIFKIPIGPVHLGAPQPDWSSSSSSVSGS